MWIILYILIVLTAVVFIPGQLEIKLNDRFWMPKEVVFITLGFCVLACSWFFDNVKRLYFRNPWFGALMIYTILSFTWIYLRPWMMLDGVFMNLLKSPYSEVLARHGIEKLIYAPVGFAYWNVRPTINVMLGLMLIQCLVENTDSLSRWVNTAKVLCWVSGLYACYALLQWVGVDQIFSSGYRWNHENNIEVRKTYMVTFMSNKFLTTNYLAMISPLCLMFKQLRYKIFYLLIFIVLILADVTVSLIAFCFCFLLYLVLRRRYWLSLGLVGLVVLLFIASGKVFPYFWTIDSRIQLWLSIVKDVINNGKFFTGNGLGSFAGHFKSGTLLALSAHNEFIQMLYEGGLILVVIVCGYLITFLRRLYFLSDNSVLFIGYFCAFVSCLIISLAGFPLRIAPLALLIILFIASLETQIRGGKYVG